MGEVVEECPCKGERSVTWHYRRKLSACKAAKAKRKASEGCGPKPAAVEPPCKCRGVRNEYWHKKNKVKFCKRIRDARNEQDRGRYTVRIGNRRLSWRPGTDIEIPEHDPL